MAETKSTGKKKTIAEWQESFLTRRPSSPTKVYEHKQKRTIAENPSDKVPRALAKQADSLAETTVVLTNQTNAAERKTSTGLLKDPSAAPNRTSRSTTARAMPPRGPQQTNHPVVEPERRAGVTAVPRNTPVAALSLSSTQGRSARAAGNDQGVRTALDLLEQAGLLTDSAASAMSNRDAAPSIKPPAVATPSTQRLPAVGGIPPFLSGASEVPCASIVNPAVASSKPTATSEEVEDRAFPAVPVLTHNVAARNLDREHGQGGGDGGACVRGPAADPLAMATPPSASTTPTAVVSAASTATKCILKRTEPRVLRRPPLSEKRYKPLGTTSPPDLIVAAIAVSAMSSPATSIAARTVGLPAELTAISSRLRISAGPSTNLPGALTGEPTIPAMSHIANSRAAVPAVMLNLNFARAPTTGPPTIPSTDLSAIAGMASEPMAPPTREPWAARTEDAFSWVQTASPSTSLGANSISPVGFAAALARAQGLILALINDIPSRRVKARLVMSVAVMPTARVSAVRPVDARGDGLYHEGDGQGVRGLHQVTGDAHLKRALALREITRPATVGTLR